MNTIIIVLAGLVVMTTAAFVIVWTRCINKARAGEDFTRLNTAGKWLSVAVNILASTLIVLSVATLVFG